METPPRAGRVRWLVAGGFQPSPSGRRFLLTARALEEQLERAARGLLLTVEDRIGSGEASTYELSFDGLAAFQLSRVIDALPELRTLRTLHDALSGTRELTPEESARLGPAVGRGRLFSAMAQAVRGASSPEEARRATLAAVEEALFGTARDLLQHEVVSRLESSWRGLHWLWEHCPPAAGMDVEVLDVGPHQLEEALAECLDASPLQRPDACFLLDAVEDTDALHRLAALGEAAWVPLVVPVREALPPEAWERLRADEASRWLCAAHNPVVMAAEEQGEVRRACFTSPVLAVAALLAASYRDTRTFARLTGPGSGTRAPAVWRPSAGSTVATEVGLSLHEQQRLASQGLLGVGGWWDSDAVLLAAAPSLYRGRDAAPLPAQLLTGRIVRLALELTGRLPAGAGNEAVAAFFSAAEAHLSAGQPGACQLRGRVVPTGGGARGLHVRASLRPELAGTHLQLEFTLPVP